jgi:hypothetical protein
VGGWDDGAGVVVSRSGLDMTCGIVCWREGAGVVIFCNGLDMTGCGIVCWRKGAGMVVFFNGCGIVWEWGPETNVAVSCESWDISGFDLVWRWRDEAGWIGTFFFPLPLPDIYNNKKKIKVMKLEVCQTLINYLYEDIKEFWKYRWQLSIWKNN